ncbi:hypothetical protein CDAR_230991 [Caerostris darwini]|uniref:Uncharacterized protein n=1 Tax=Caerostris darwini TaxID=1538125 RepID=A0AAV4S2P9_9ARAC|nr:hypothetical protein CDAR_230991 [Caerostris darwini]
MGISDYKIDMDAELSSSRYIRTLPNVGLRMVTDENHKHSFTCKAELSGTITLFLNHQPDDQLSNLIGIPLLESPGRTGPLIRKSTSL